MPVNMDLWKIGLVKQDSVTDEITSQVDKGNCVDVIEFCKAFELVVHDILIKKLALYNSNKAHAKMIKNWLTHRS